MYGKDLTARIPIYD